MKNVLKRMSMDELNEFRTDSFIKRMHAGSKAVYDYFANLTDQIDEEIAERMA